MDEYAPIQLVADFVTLLTAYPEGFMVITEPMSSAGTQVPEPIMQLTCLGTCSVVSHCLTVPPPLTRFAAVCARCSGLLERRADASIAARPVFEKYATVVLTSGTLSPLDMYPKMLRFTPGVSQSLNTSLSRQCIKPIVVARGADQVPLTTKFDKRQDKAVVHNFGVLLIKMCEVVPDGIVAFFPSYSYMTFIVTQWHRSRVLEQIQRRKLLYFETKDIVETTLAVSAYKAACTRGRGAVFLSVARGKVAEGIDFKGHFGRMVILFGIPFQYTLAHTLRARLAYLRDQFGIQESEFLTFDAIRQTAQCLGRVIRSKSDYGMMLLADMRYGKRDKYEKLPRWISQHLTGTALSMSIMEATVSARQFFRDMAKPDPGLATLPMDVTHLLYGPSTGPAVASGATATSGTGAGVGAGAAAGAGAGAGAAASDKRVSSWSAIPGPPTAKRVRVEEADGVKDASQPQPAPAPPQ